MVHSCVTEAFLQHLHQYGAYPLLQATMWWIIQRYHRKWYQHHQNLDEVPYPVIKSGWIPGKASRISSPSWRRLPTVNWQPGGFQQLKKLTPLNIKRKALLSLHFTKCWSVLTVPWYSYTRFGPCASFLLQNSSTSASYVFTAVDIDVIRAMIHLAVHRN